MSSARELHGHWVNMMSTCSYTGAIVALLVLCGSPVSAASYEVTVSRVADDVYQLNYNGPYAVTRFCYKYSAGDAAILDLSDAYPKLIWKDDNTACDVIKVLGVATLPEGAYRVRPVWRGGGLYENLLSDTYLFSDICAYPAIGTTAYLDWDGLSGRLTFDTGYQCQIGKVLSPVR